MAVPSRLLIHQIVVVHPAGSSDAYGTVFDYGASAARSTITGWLRAGRALCGKCRA